MKTQSNNLASSSFRSTYTGKQALFASESDKWSQQVQATNYTNGKIHVAASYFMCIAGDPNPNGVIIRYIRSGRSFVANEKREFGGRKEPLANTHFALTQLITFSLKHKLLTLRPGQGIRFAPIR